MILTCKDIEVRRNHKCQTIDGAKTFVLKLYASNASYFTQKGQLFVILLLKKNNKSSVAYSEWNGLNSFLNKDEEQAIMQKKQIEPS